MNTERVKLREIGITPITKQEMSRATAKERRLTVYSFKSGYSPITVGNTVMMDVDMIGLALVFSNQNAKKKWMKFENDMNEITFQGFAFNLMALNETPFYRVRDTKKLCDWAEGTGTVFSSLIDLENGRYLALID